MCARARRTACPSLSVISASVLIRVFAEHQILAPHHMSELGKGWNEDLELFIGGAHYCQVDHENNQILAPHHMLELGKNWNKDVMFASGCVLYLL